MRELLLSQKTDAEEYKTMKAVYTGKIEKLLAKQVGSKEKISGLEGIIKFRYGKPDNALNLYKEGDIVKKGK